MVFFFSKRNDFADLFLRFDLFNFRTVECDTWRVGRALVDSPLSMADGYYSRQIITKRKKLSVSASR